MVKTAENKTAKEWFKKWSNKYDKTLGKMKRHHDLLDLAVKMSAVKKNDKVLDMGCGTGFLSLKYMAKVPCTITAIDNSKEMLSIFKDKVKHLGLEYSVKCILCDASDMKFKDNSFDIAAGTVALHHIKDKQPVINRIYKLLKPGGRIVIGELDIDTTGKIDDIKRLKRIMEYLTEELTHAVKGAGEKALSQMFDNGKKHLLNDGEYCISAKQWANLCKKAGFKKIKIGTVSSFKRLKVIAAVKLEGETT